MVTNVLITGWVIIFQLATSCQTPMMQQEAFHLSGLVNTGTFLFIFIWNRKDFKSLIVWPDHPKETAFGQAVCSCWLMWVWTGDGETSKSCCIEKVWFPVFDQLWSIIRAKKLFYSNICSINFKPFFLQTLCIQQDFCTVSGFYLASDAHCLFKNPNKSDKRCII